MAEALKELLKSGGTWAALLIAVVIYLLLRQKEIDRLHKSYQAKIESLNRENQNKNDSLNKDRLQDRENFQKIFIEQNALLASCLNGLAKSQNKMAETLSKLCETLDEVFAERNNPSNPSTRKR